jgi:hypothetical protein
MSSLPDKKEEIVKKFNEEIEKISLKDSIRFKDILIQNLKVDLEKIMTYESIKSINDIKDYNFMKSSSINIIDIVLNRKA